MSSVDPAIFYGRAPEILPPLVITVVIQRRSGIFFSVSERAYIDNALSKERSESLKSVSTKYSERRSSRFDINRSQLEELYALGEI